MTWSRNRSDSDNLLVKLGELSPDLSDRLAVEVLADAVEPSGGDEAAVGTLSDAVTLGHGSDSYPSHEKCCQPVVKTMLTRRENWGLPDSKTGVVHSHRGF